jgi:hypothetical protein
MSQLSEATRRIVDDLKAQSKVQKVSPSAASAATPATPRSAHRDDPRFEAYEAFLRDPVAQPPRQRAPLPWAEVEDIMLVQNHFPACWGALGEEAKVESVPMPDARPRASQYLNDWRNFIFAHASGVRAGSASPRCMPAMKLALQAGGGFNSVWRYDETAGADDGAPERLYPPTLHARLRRQEVLVRICNTASTAGLAHEHALSEAVHMLFGAQCGFSPRVAAVGLFSKLVRRNDAHTTCDAVPKMEWFVIAFLERAPCGSARCIRRVATPPPLCRSPASNWWLREVLDALAFVAFLYSREHFVALDVKLENFVVFFPCVWGTDAVRASQRVGAQQRLAEASSAHRVRLIDVGADVFKRVEAPHANADAASHAHKAIWLHNVLVLSAILKREVAPATFESLWWSKVGPAAVRLSAHLRAPQEPRGGDPLHTIAVKLLNETEWSTGGPPPRFAFFRESKFTAKFQFGNDLCTLQRSALLYAQYYFVEYFLRDLELNVVAKLPGRNDARVAGEHRIDVQSAVDHFNNYLANGLPIAAHFLELRRGPRRTLAAALLAYVQSNLGDSRARVREKATPLTASQATAARLHGDKALIVFGRLDSLVHTNHE